MLIADFIATQIRATGIAEAPIRWLDMRYVNAHGDWLPETTEDRDPKAYWRVGVVSDEMPNGTVTRSLASVLIQFGTEAGQADWLSNVRLGQAYIVKLLDLLRPYTSGTVSHGVVRMMGTGRACGYQARLTLLYNPSECCD